MVDADAVHVVAVDVEREGGCGHRVRVVLLLLAIQPAPTVLGVRCVYCTISLSRSCVRQQRE